MSGIKNAMDFHFNLEKYLSQKLVEKEKWNCKIDNITEGLCK